MVASYRRDAAKRQGEKETGMADCEMIANCIFFNDKMANKPGTANLLKSKYCKGAFAECVRRQVCQRLGKDKVPADLYPNQTDRAKELLR